MVLGDFVERLADLVTHLREHGIRSFKGELFDASGARIWNLDMTFERPEPRPVKREDDE